MTQTQKQLDTDLKEAVVDELAWTPSVNSAHIGVAADHGAITLSGQVETYPQKLAAEKAALRVQGVTAVDEEVKVRNVSGATNDADVAREASEALERDVNVPSGSVKAVVENHCITLSGPVTWNFQREAAERAVRYLKGVTGVYNKVTLKPTVSADGIKTKISAAFLRNATLESENLMVTADKGVVTLQGTVHTAAERRQADLSAWSAPGVTKVLNLLTIDR